MDATTVATEGKWSSAGIMTPSSSGRTVKLLEPMFPTPIPFSYLSPSPTPSPSNHPIPNEIFDILGGLYCYGPLEMAQKVISYLDPADLLSCLLVSKTWNVMFSENLQHLRKMDEYKSTGRKRTFSQMNSSTDLIPRPPPRQVLADISINSIQLFRLEKPTEVTTLDSLDQPRVQRCPCPNCKSHAVLLHLRRAECKKCNFDFCRHCFRSYHEGHCRTTQELWGGDADCDSGPSKLHIAGKKSKAVKRRLKRL